MAKKSRLWFAARVAQETTSANCHTWDEISAGISFEKKKKEVGAY